MMEPAQNPEVSSSTDTKKKFECPVCPRSFNVWWNLASHYSVHQRAGEVEGRHPPPGYQPPPTRLTHEESRQRELQQRNTWQLFECKCKKVFSKSTDLSAHQAGGECHEERDDDKSQATSGSTKKKKVQNGGSSTERKFDECPLCGKEVAKGTLARHMRSHVGGKSFKCDLCNASLSSNTNLKRHYREVHHVEPPTAPTSNGSTSNVETSQIN